MERKTGARGLRAIMVSHSVSAVLFISVEFFQLILTYLLSALEDEAFSTLLGRYGEKRYKIF
jgi:hypothetical protein